MLPFNEMITMSALY